jgi:cob(I)alamin adenosyltransferase
MCKEKRKGYIQVYTGDGKGKTTAALGLALRAVGAGMKVFIAQFVKGCDYSELESIKKLSEYITIKQYGREKFIYDVENEDIERARKGLNEVKEIIRNGEYDIVILDEANIAVNLKLFSPQELIEIISSKPEHMEIVITGRYADPLIIEKADLVTEMVEIKHYYKNGVKARNGIEK